ncbi:MAG: restriction endonuclease, partial [Methylococcales symbiont of Iophon sp. n. MRB-2018]
LGKTIIFAKNHQHAVFIEERFNKHYPEYVGKFLRVIDNYESKAQDLLEIFVDPYEEHEPQIAVSVDMMDTGVDAPRVVNLLFFKRVMSSTKFWQMIGRGTRLCPDLYGQGQDKDCFMIFDYCENIEFFSANPDGIEGKAIKSLTQQVFEAKLEVALLIRDKVDSSDEQKALAVSYIDELHLLIASLDHARFVVGAALREVVEFSQKTRWDNISKSDMLDINSHLSALVLPIKEDDEQARRFDILILRYQLALLTGAYSTQTYINKINTIAKDLLKKQNIPAVALQAELLKKLQTEVFWMAVTINRLDEVRLALRDLIKYLNKDEQVHVITNFEDDLNHAGIKEPDLLPEYSRLQSYKDRVECYVRNHKEHLVIRKLKTNKPITATEINTLETILFDAKTVGTKQDYIDNYGDKPLGVFIRGIVGLDVSAAQDAFAEFILAGTLSGDQMTFVKTIITYLTKNGMIDKAMLFKPLFTNIHDQSVFGLFDNAQATQMIRLIDGINENALAQQSA